MFNPIEIHNIVDREYQEKLLATVTNIEFPWYFLEDTTFEKSNDLLKSTPSFVNLIYHPDNSTHQYLDIFKPCLDNLLEKQNLKLDKLLRMRLGFLLNTKYYIPSLPYKYNTPHRDYDQEHYTAVYYLNSTDGDTVIFREIEKSEKYNVLHKSTPEQGKILLFNGWHYHASTCPKMFTKRIALTINFTCK